MILKLKKKKSIKKNILHDPGKSLIFFILPPNLAVLDACHLLIPGLGEKERSQKNCSLRFRFWVSNSVKQILAANCSQCCAGCWNVMPHYETATCFFHLASNKELGLPSAIRDHLTSSSHESMMPRVLLTLLYAWGSSGTEMNWLVQAIQLLRVRTRIWTCVTQSHYPLCYILPTWELVARGKKESTASDIPEICFLPMFMFQEQFCGGIRYKWSQDSRC